MPKETRDDCTEPLRAADSFVDIELKFLSVGDVGESSQTL